MPSVGRLVVQRKRVGFDSHIPGNWQQEGWFIFECFVARDRSRGGRDSRRRVGRIPLIGS